VIQHLPVVPKQSSIKAGVLNKKNPKIHSNRLDLSLELSSINLCGDRTKFNGMMKLNHPGQPVNVSQKFEFIYDDPCKNRSKYTIEEKEDFEIHFVIFYNNFNF
jgi:hypothetical protein